jgi:hypothetical protein
MNNFQVSLNLVTQDPISASYLATGSYPVTSSWSNNSTSASYATSASFAPTGVSSGIVPIGAIIAWHKSFSNTPSLPSEFVECNGQTLSDAESVYNGQIIPNLNASRFLRGATTSGTNGGSGSHSHTLNGISYHNIDSSFGGTGAYTWNTNTGNVTDSTSSLPPYFEVVWVMRIK